MRGVPPSVAVARDSEDAELATLYPAEGFFLTSPSHRILGGRVLKFASCLTLPAIATAAVVALTAPRDTPTVVPLGCTINWTRTGGGWIYTPDCPKQSPGPPPQSPPPVSDGPPGGPPLP